ncbi:hypothetical protein GEMRC1_007093 [Eukaryota sp. GEM-RC1]
MTNSNVSTILKTAETAYSKHNIELALQTLAQGVVDFPTEVSLLDAFAEGLLFAGNSSLARQHFLHAAELSPLSNVGRYMYLAQLSTSQDSLNFYNLGIQTINQQDLVDLEKTNFSALLTYLLQSYTSLTFASKPMLNQSVKRTSHWLSNTTLLIQNQCKQDEALSFLSKFDEINTQDPTATSPVQKLNAAKFYYEMNSFSKSVDYADQVLATDDSNIDAYIVYASALFQDGEKEEALEVVEKAIVLANVMGMNELISELEQLKTSFST